MCLLIYLFFFFKDQIGLTPEEVISKIMANPEVAMAFQNPRVQAAIMDVCFFYPSFSFCTLGSLINFYKEITHNCYVCSVLKTL